MKGLSTHVLDTLNGVPAAGVAIELWYCGKTPTPTGTECCVAQNITNKEGRCVMLENMEIGEYELRFAVGAYFEKKRTESKTVGGEQTSPFIFLNTVPVRFFIANATAHYHIPLVVTPFSYSTYKGGAAPHAVSIPLPTL